MIDTTTTQGRAALQQMRGLGRRLLAGEDPAVATAYLIFDRALAGSTEDLHWYLAGDISADAAGYTWTIERYVDSGDGTGDGLSFLDAGFTAAESARIHAILSTVDPDHDEEDD
ncbi:hypothetical protein [Acidipropionibacterium timonense]|uniref:hypothetical protein n=1 Tax=Acidipropionibacterium timonense TaxID=2161818 RepID=UPI00102FE77A|nr:hypothetical protein [Acidipropionibacterium timonense]